MLGRGEEDSEEDEDDDSESEEEMPYRLFEGKYLVKRRQESDSDDDVEDEKKPDTYWKRNLRDVNSSSKKTGGDLYGKLSPYNKMSPFNKVRA